MALLGVKMTDFNGLQRLLKCYYMLYTVINSYVRIGV